jgi:hypothetical protein
MHAFCFDLNQRRFNLKHRGLTDEASTERHALYSNVGLPYKMKRPFLILLFSTLAFFRAFGQEDFLLRQDKILPTDKQWTDLQLQYNSIPIDRLKLIERDLDSTISATDCYKFLYNTDSTKFIAFFIMHKDNPKFDRLIHFGRSVHIHYRPSDNDSFSFLSYILWGMKYENNWYYHKDYEDEFWDKSSKSAKEDFVFFVLNDIGYLKTKNIDNFWEKGGETNQFNILLKSDSYLNEYAGLPEIVGWHKTFQIRRQKDLLNEKTEKITCAIQDDLWNTLHQSDSIAFHTRYKSKYSGKSCLTLYNSDRSKVLLPLLYYDSKSNPRLTYYFAKINSADTLVYKWTKFPTKKINRKPGNESLEIVYDIRTFIENWNWGTVNMISNESFWTGNFSHKDLEQWKK